MSRVIKKYEDLIAFHPGYYLDELIDSLDMTQEEFARRIKIKAKTISEITNGNQNMSIDVANKISNMTGTGIDLWLNLQKEYDKKVLEIEQIEELKKEEEILKDIDYSYFIKLFKIEKSKDTTYKIKTIREKLKIGSLTVLKEENLVVNFRNPSGKFEDKNIINSNILLQIAKEKAKDIEVSKFNKKKLISSLDKIRMINLEEPEHFYKKLLALLSECGIALVLLPHLKNSGINGAVTKINKDKIMLLLTDRNKYSDIFWFSLFHELGHIVNGDFKISITNDHKDEYEQKADEFARDRLIDQNNFKAFVIKQDFTQKAILEFSKDNGIQAGILLGRLQKEKYIQYGYLNNLKIKYEV
ncbi:HigA family addiction module antidote protein [Peptoanaerobacter stomatis]|uniref:HigA family addiction module antidote protein n=1 Tax=Peptoanaerobacter stomatis TaxID=796937 RepID=V9HV87_9FIRM|nr:HigA family addiction module antitoxin [Peptoanaerobacter stomatis]EHL18519.1 HigA family addiction module antidote protein [Peptoanaerobacter stomatis]